MWSIGCETLSIVSVAPSASPKAVIHAVSGLPSIDATPALATEPVSRVDARTGQPNKVASASSGALRSTRTSTAGVSVRAAGSSNSRTSVGSGSSRQRSMGSVRNLETASVSGVAVSTAASPSLGTRTTSTVGGSWVMISAKPTPVTAEAVPAVPPPTASIAMSIVVAPSGRSINCAAGVIESSVRWTAVR